MNTQQTLEQMKQLRLTGMAHAYQTQLELPVHQQLEAHPMIAQLIHSEQLARQQEKTIYYLKLAKLRLPAIPEQVICSPARNFSKQQLATLLEGGYMDQGENVL